MAGERVGRTLGFPTANLDSTGILLPPKGVYAAVATFQGGRKPAAVNIGVRPTGGRGRAGRGRCAWRRICWISRETSTVSGSVWSSVEGCGVRNGFRR